MRQVSHWPGSQDEVSAAVDPADPSILLAGSNSLQFDPSVRVYGPTDAGLYWTSDLLPLPTTAKSAGAAGTDAFLPAAAYDPSKQTLWACAYVSLANTPAETRYTCTASQDAGAHFLPPTAVALATSNEEQPGAFRNFIGRPYGDYTDLVAADGMAHAFWTGSRTLTLEEEIYTASLHLAAGVGATG